MSSSVERFDEKARRIQSLRPNCRHRGELLRHPVYTRVLHWCARSRLSSLFSQDSRSTRQAFSLAHTTVGRRPYDAFPSSVVWLVLSTSFFSFSS